MTDAAQPLVNRIADPAPQAATLAPAAATPTPPVGEAPPNGTPTPAPPQVAMFTPDQIVAMLAASGVRTVLLAMSNRDSKGAGGSAAILFHGSKQEAKALAKAAMGVIEDVGQ